MKAVAQYSYDSMPQVTSFDATYILPPVQPAQPAQSAQAETPPTTVKPMETSETKDTKPRTLAQLTRILGTEVEAYVEIGQANVLLPFRDSEGAPAFAVDKVAYSKLSPLAKRLMGIADKLSFLMKVELYCKAQVYGQGPKIFRPTAEQLFALEKMKLNLEMRDFHTPFETIVVEFPEEYSKARTHATERAVNYSVLHFNRKQNFILHDVIYDTDGLKSFWAAKSEEEILEDWFGTSVGSLEAGEELREFQDDDWFPGDIKTSGAELKLEMLIRRAVCNYCLLLDEVGTKQVGPAVPNQYNQLVKWCQKNNHHTRMHKLQLAAQPILYGLKAAPTPLVRHVKSDENGEPVHTGKIMPYHMRRGHYKLQPYGPQSSLRKRIRIPAVIVNAHLAPGLPPSQEYRT